MSKKKLRQGPLITSLDQLARCEWVIIYGKPYCRGWVASWQLRMAKRYVDSGKAYEGIRLTNGQYYPKLMDEQIKARFDKELRRLSPCQNGVDCPISTECTSAYCWKALAAWKEAEVT